MDKKLQDLVDNFKAAVGFRELTDEQVGDAMTEVASKFEIGVGEIPYNSDAFDLLVEILGDIA